MVDEWTSQRIRRYLNIHKRIHHHYENYYKLGLIRINGYCTAEYYMELVKNRLPSFNVKFETDIIGITTDGLSVTVKVGKLLPCIQQLCLSHGINLSVVNIIYKI